MTRPILAMGTFCALVMAATAGAEAQSPAAAVPTFSRDIAPIFFRSCTSCHRPGEIAPMSLLTYQDARPWAKSIAARVAAGTMPPWHADSSSTAFTNDRRLSETDKATLLRWANGGAPEGNASDLPARPAYTEGWTIGQPDAVLAMQEDYPLPATGTIAYQYFEVPTNFTEDKWIQAFEVRPGNRAVVHHVIVYARPPARPQPASNNESPERRDAAGQRERAKPVISFAEGMEIPAGQTGGPELPAEKRKPIGPNDRPAPKMLGPLVGGYVPGNGARIYATGTATKLAAGSTLIFQVHYTTKGKETSDRTRIGLVFSKEPPKTQLVNAALANGALHIPAGASNHRVDAEMTINQDMTVWSVLPHTHVRGKRWEYQAIYPDGRTETILSVPQYDFEWQTDYIYKEPLKLPRGTKLHATAWYDNSAANKSNPDPAAEVWWGDQTFEEMMFTAFTFSLDSKPASPTAGAQK
jgi:hypothetical protein